MKIAIDGKASRVVAVYCGEKRAVALYQGEEKLWPSNGEYAIGMRLALPQPGALDYLYWQHVMTALAGADAGTPECHLKFRVQDTDYYIGASPDGSPPLKMEGDTVQLTSGVRSILADYVGTELTLEAKVPARKGRSYASPSQNVGFEVTILEPWLPGTSLTYSHYKGQKKVCSWAEGVLKGAESGVEYINVPWHNHEGHWRGDSQHTHQATEGVEPDCSGEALRLEMKVGGSSGISYCYLNYPAFTRSFQLLVKDVY